MKKILHIMHSESKFTIDFAEFAQDKLGEHHYFLPIGAIGKDKFYHKISNSIINNLVFNKYRPASTILYITKFISIIKDYDVIIWHSLFYHSFILSYIILFHKEIVKKSIWIEWGGDLYEVNFKLKFFNILYKKFINNLKAVITIFPGDIQYLKNTYNYNGKIYDGYYGLPSLSGFNDLGHISNKHNLGDNILIQVGHSNDPTNNHIKCLKILEKFKNQNIKILLPLNYGDVNYANSVEEYARKIFDENKLIILRKKMPFDKYYDLLSKVNVCIFDTFRQLGLGNLHYHLGHNKSIYLNKDGVMYKYWINIGINVRDINHIKSIDTAENLLFECKNSDSTYVKQRFDDEYYIKLWNEIFYDIENDTYDTK